MHTRSKSYAQVALTHTHAQTEQELRSGLTNTHIHTHTHTPVDEGKLAPILTDDYYTIYPNSLSDHAISYMF
jgi:hypothetical protein